MTLSSTISKWGNGQGIRLPKTLLKLMDWENNDKLEIIVEDGNIRIRKMTVSDLEPLYKLLSNSKVMQYLEAPYTKEQTEQFLLGAGLSKTP